MRDGRLDISSVSQTSETLPRTQCNGRVVWKGAPTAGISLTSSSSFSLSLSLTPSPCTSTDNRRQ